MTLKNYFLLSLQITIYFLPISLIAGSLIVNINIIAIILLGYTYLIIYNLKLYLDVKNYLLITFFLFVILSSVINSNIIGFENILKSIFLLKFLLIYLLIDTLIYNNKLSVKIFCNVCLLFVTLISLDLFLQFFYGKNILGYEPWEGRITGIFGSEAIAGGYIQKFLIFSLISIFTFSKIRNFKIDVFEVLLLSTIILASFIASNRMSFIIVLSSVLFIILFYKILRKKLLISLILLLPISIYLFQVDYQINKKLTVFKDRVNKLSIQAKEHINEDNKIVDSAQRTDHGKIYLTVIKSFSENKLIGNGLKSFRFKCSKFKSDKTACSSHPHNYHLEILHDTGIIGFSLLSLFVILFLFQKYKNLRFSNLKYLDKIIISLLVLNFLIEVFPLKSTGSLFSTWTGTILWTSIAFANFGNNKRNEF